MAKDLRLEHLPRDRGEKVPGREKEERDRGTGRESRSSGELEE